MERFLATIGDSTMGIGKLIGGRRVPHGTICIVVYVIAGMVSNSGCTQKAGPRPDRAYVSGTVKFKDKLVTGGTLTFVSVIDPNATAGCLIREDGTYRVADAPIGQTQIAIDTESLKPELGGRYVQIPTRYSAAQTSGLTYTIEPGKNKNADFKLD
jgi:hypothetical protein